MQMSNSLAFGDYFAANYSKGCFACFWTISLVNLLCCLCKLMQLGDTTVNTSCCYQKDCKTVASSTFRYNDKMLGDF